MVFLFAFEISIDYTCRYRVDVANEKKKSLNSQLLLLFTFIYRRVFVIFLVTDISSFTPIKLYRKTFVCVCVCESYIKLMFIFLFLFVFVSFPINIISQNFRVYNIFL